MKPRIYGVLANIAVTLLTIGALFTGYRIYAIANYAHASAAYLFLPTDVKTDKGQALTRAQILDQIIAQATKAPK